MHTITIIVFNLVQIVDKEAVLVRTEVKALVASSIQDIDNERTRKSIREKQNFKGHQTNKF